MILWIRYYTRNKWALYWLHRIKLQLSGWKNHLLIETPPNKVDNIRLVTQLFIICSIQMYGLIIYLNKKPFDRSNSSTKGTIWARPRVALLLLPCSLWSCWTFDLRVIIGRGYYWSHTIIGSRKWTHMEIKPESHGFFQLFCRRVASPCPPNIPPYSECLASQTTAT